MKDETKSNLAIFLKHFAIGFSAVWVLPWLWRAITGSSKGR